MPAGKSTDAMRSHQPPDAAVTAAVAFCPQLGVHAWTAVAVLVARLHAADLNEELAVGSSPRALRAGPPGVVAARRHIEHAADEAHRVGGRMLFDEREPQPGTSAKMPMASFGTSRSIRVRSS
jgi:hypothetical protein